MFCMGRRRGHPAYQEFMYRKPTPSLANSAASSTLHVFSRILAKHQRSDPVNTLECQSPLEDPVF